MSKEASHTATAPTQDQPSNLAIISLVLGVVSLTGPGFLLGIPAIITSSIALKKKTSGRGLSIAGLVTGIVSTVCSLLFWSFIIFIVIWEALSTPPQGVPVPQNNWNSASQQQGSQPFNGSRT